MAQLMASVCLAILGFIVMGIETTTKCDREVQMVFGVMIFLAAAGSFIAAICISISVRDSQLKDKEKILEYDNVIAILKEKADVLVEEFKSHLSQYPDIEKEIFDKIKPGNITVYMAQYPEIKSSEILKALAGNIANLYSSVYNKRVRKEELLAEIRYRPQNPWVLPRFVPVIEVEDNLSKERRKEVGVGGKA